MEEWDWIRWERKPHNDPFGTRPEPGAGAFASILKLPPGEAPEGPGPWCSGYCRSGSERKRALRARAGNGLYGEVRIQGPGTIFIARLS